MSAAESIAYRTCPLCEATCGLELHMSGRDVVSVRGDKEDVFSRGFICPKGASLGELHSDPDRLRKPLVKRDGEFVEVEWDEAFAAVEEGLRPILDSGDRNAMGVYIGNPNAHTLDGLTTLRALVKVIGTRNIFSASTVDQRPKEVSCGLMFGGGLSVPVPDIDRCDHLIMLGANPLASNGSLWTVPDVRGRMRKLRDRGGKIVVIDPRRSRTAELADEHHFVRPGRDAHLLAGMAHTILAEGLDDPGALAEHTAGLDEIAAHLSPFSPEAVSPACGVPAEEIRRLARDLAAAEHGCVYGRIGTTTQAFGALTSWLVDVLNVLTGNLDREGGAMFPMAAAGARNASGAPGVGRGVKFGRWSTRVRKAGETYGELPVACLAEEIDTPGDGRIRAMLTVAGNPAVSTPNSGRLDAALDSLDFMVSVDVYLNETTRHADVILPAPSPLERSHYDLAFYQLSVRNIARFTPPTLELADGMRPEWETLLRLVGIVTGQGSDCDVEALDDFVAAEAVRRELATPGSPLEGRDAAEVLAELEPRRGPERLLDLMLRAGPYDLTLDEVEAATHGIDLGPLKPRIPDMIRTASGKVELAPAELIADLPRLESSLGENGNGILLVGRRQLRSNNSWMHNLPHLVRGKDRCTLHIHPDDAGRIGLDDGGTATVRSRVGEVIAPVEVTDAIMPGVVSIPHGWGHDRPGTRLGVAATVAGVNSNLLTDEAELDPLSGNAVLNGIPVTVEPAA